MYFAIIEAFPNTDSEAAQKYGGAQVACWINLPDWTQARTKALSLVAESGWQAGNFVEEKEVSSETYANDHSAHEYFDQALVDGEVCVFYTFPKNGS